VQQGWNVHGTVTLHAQNATNLGQLSRPCRHVYCKSAPNMAQPTSTNSSTVSDALLRGVDYLLRALSTGGWYDVWEGAPIERTRSVMTAYFLARALHDAGRLESEQAASVAGALEAARQGASYAYAPGLPIDADDTAFALRTRCLLGNAPSIAEARAAMAPFEDRGGYRTFSRRPRGTLAWTVSVHDEDSIIGLHPEVNLNVLALLREIGTQAAAPPDTLPRNAAGLLASYHYPSELYATWLAVEASGSAEVATLLARRLPGGGWRAIPSGWSESCETALGVLLIGSAGSRCDLAPSLLRLCALQRADGGWPGGVLWRYTAEQPVGGGLWWSIDVCDAVSTALGVMALARCQERRFKEPRGADMPSEWSLSRHTSTPAAAELRPAPRYQR
jgi:hypothetical protein